MFFFHSSLLALLFVFPPGNNYMIEVQRHCCSSDFYFFYYVMHTTVEMVEAKQWRQCPILKGRDRFERVLGKLDKKEWSSDERQQENLNN